MGDTTGCSNCEGEGVPRYAEISVAVQPDLEIQGSSASAAAILVTNTNTSGDDAVDDPVHRDDGDGGVGKPTTTTSSLCGMLDKACVAVFRCRFAGGVKEELLAVWKMAWPICLGYALWMQIGVVNLIFMGHDPEISAAAARFMKIISPSLFPFFLYESTERTLQCQGIVFPAMIICAASVVLLVILLCFFVLYLGLGLTGSAMSMTIVYFFMPSVLIPYILIRKLHRQLRSKFHRNI
ncbi:hypothetical protein Pelo_4774 [Pelomyxa schiedti]|nr:hypothetical protein Pelo_4774 [Pelomyxa schiedti]